MLLRHKFGVLVLVYLLSLTGTLATSVWCIVVYFQSAFHAFETTVDRQNRVEHLRADVRSLRDRFERDQDDARRWSLAREDILDFAAAAERLDAEFSTPPTAGAWQNVRESLRQALDVFEPDAGTEASADAAPANGTQDPRADSGASPPARLADDALGELELALAGVSRVLTSRRQTEVESVAATQRRVVTLLSFNAVGGAGLCLVGFVYVRRWVTRPVATLRQATRHIADGDFAWRINIGAHDELGMLSREVNEMCATIVSMQTRLVEQERLAAAGEMVMRLAHNIRNPLAGLRGLAESTVQHHAGDPETVECQTRIIDTVDRFEKWLRDLQQSVSPLVLNVAPTPVRELIDNVVKVILPMAQRRRVTLQTDVADAAQRVRMDAAHVEQALVALITNAVQASPAGGRVGVRVEPDPRSPRHWRLIVEDQGAGVPPELREKIFLPYFTTKPQGNGMGLAMAAKIVKLHGGRLELDAGHSPGSRFVAVMPGLLVDE